MSTDVCTLKDIDLQGIFRKEYRTTTDDSCRYFLVWINTQNNYQLTQDKRADSDW